MMNIRQVLAENLKLYRHALGWSQATLAEKVDSNTSYIGMIEICKKFPSPKMIEKLAAALGIDSTLLFYKRVVPSDTMNSLKMVALAEIEDLIGRFIGVQIENLARENAREAPSGKETSLGTGKHGGVLEKKDPET